jgi:uncharacterized protein YkwD
MKNKTQPHPISVVLPRIKGLPLSRFLPHLMVLAVLMLLACTIHVPGQQIARNRVVNDNRPSPNGLASSSSPISMERRVFDRVNEVRAEHGLRALVWVDQMAAVARNHSNNMATNNFFGHQDPQGRRTDKRLDQAGLDHWRQVSENIAWISGNSDPVARVVQAWMQSAGHRSNILDPVSRESGIGLAITPEGKYYFTQVFMRR